MKIATWNVNGIRAREAQLCEWMERDRPDVVCLQEIKAEPAQVPARCQLADYHVYWHGQRGYSGVSLHVRKDFVVDTPAFAHPEFDMETRIVQARLGDVVVASVYVPNGGKDYAAKIAFVKALVAWARRVHAQGLGLVICGDINIARQEVDVHPRERKPGIIGQLPEERELFAALLADGLVDVGRTFAAADDRLFTWWPPWRNMRQKNIGWRIDYILASKAIAERAQSCVVLSDVGTSDHAPVMMTVDGAFGMVSAGSASACDPATSSPPASPAQGSLDLAQ